MDDRGLWSSVVGVVSRKGDLVARCSGALLAPDLVLTARHCVAFDDGKPVTCGQSPLGASVDPAGVLVTGFNQMSDAPADYVAAAEIIPAPGGDDTCGFDLALVRLTGTPPGAEQPFRPRLDRPVTPGEAFTAVGYGSDGTSGVGTRHYQDGVRAACVADGCGMPEVRNSEWLAEDGAFCFADSGAAALDAAGDLIGIVSRGQDPCSTPILAALPAWQGWLREAARSAPLASGFAPEWAMEPESGATDERPPLKSTCAFAVPAGGSAIAPWLVLFAVVGLRALRSPKGNRSLRT